MNKKISGAGGGGKSGGGAGGAPTESADSLQSRAFIQIIDLVSEGEIEGLVDGYRSIFLDDTPIQNRDGTYNYPGFEIATRNGTQDQNYIEGFSATEKETIVSTESKSGIPIIKTITNPEIDAVRIRVSIPQLTYQNPSTGDLSGSEVSFAIDVQANGGGFKEILKDTIIGKCVSKYERSYRVPLEGNGPWDIRLRRISPDSTSVTLNNKTFFESYTEIVDGKMKYPNSALVALKVDASQFNSVPVRGYDMKLLRVRIPNNYNPETRTYAGEWDGNFYIAWTDNPAWIFYDLLTSERYGLGAFIPEDHIDKWALYKIAKYCDELIPNGIGGTEPRFTCNVYLQSAEEAYKVVQDMASVFRGMLYWANGTISTVQDSPEDPVMLFNTSNVVDGLFTYSGSSAKTRHSVALVTWNDPEDYFKQKVEYVEDAEAIARYGVIKTSIVAFGCTSRGQANRVGRWLLFTEQYQTETVSFKTGLNGASLRPGNIISVADPVRAGSRRGGRVIECTLDQLTVDQEMSINPSTHKVSVLMKDGKIEERQVQTAFGKVINVTAPFSSLPCVGTVWMVSSIDLLPQQFKIIGIKEAEGGVHEVTALAHNPNKYDAIENGLKLEPRRISTLTILPDPPVGLKITETLYEVNGEVRVKVTFSWNIVRGATSYAITYQRDNQNPINLPETSSNDIEILDAEPGVYMVSVRAINSVGGKSTPSNVSKRVQGKSLPPRDVEGFSIMPHSPSTGELSWIKSSDLDVLIGGAIRIRWTPDTEDVVWRNSIDIIPAVAGSANRAIVPLRPGTYMAKFVDSSGISSNVEAKIITTIPTPLALNVVQDIIESPSFEGEMINMEYFDEYQGIALQAKISVDNIDMNIDEVVNWDFAGGVSSEGEYHFKEVFDLGEVFTSRLTAHLKSEALDVADLIDLREGMVDDWLDLDGDFIDDVNAEIFVQTTEDDPADPEVKWTEWKRFFIGEYKARAFKFKVVATSGSPEHNIVIKELSVQIDMPDRIEAVSGIETPAGVYEHFYQYPFRDKPVIGTTSLNLNAGDSYEITNETRQGFHILFKDSDGLPVSRKFNLMAKGYGLEII